MTCVDVTEENENAVVDELRATIAAQSAELELLRKFLVDAREADHSMTDKGKANMLHTALADLDKASKGTAAAEPEQASGIYDKFRVTRTDGSSGPGGKHEFCRYFVLDWVHDKFAVPAARAYAFACKKEFPELAKNLRKTADEAEAIHGKASKDGTR